MGEDWQKDLGRWLGPFLNGLGNKTQRRMCLAYVAGLIGSGDRKSIRPMAARSGEVSYDQLHHFIGSAVWDSAPLEAELWEEADALVGGTNAFLIIGDTALPKKGTGSVGVAHQPCAALGKWANCQTLVSIALESSEVPVMLRLRLFLPDNWIQDRARLDKAGVPATLRQSKSKSAIAIEEIDQVMAAGIRFGCVVAEAEDGHFDALHQALRARRLRWAVGIPPDQKVFPAGLQPVFSVTAQQQPRLHHLPEVEWIAAQTMLQSAKSRQISWRRGTDTGRVARFAAMRVRIAHGPREQIRFTGAEYVPGAEVWLIGEHHSTAPRNYYLSNLPPDTPIKDLAKTIKTRWIYEQAHQHLKDDLGLDHFEGRSWTGLHRHALMTMIAHAFLQQRRLSQTERKNRRRTVSSFGPFRDSTDHSKLRSTDTSTFPLWLKSPV